VTRPQNAANAVHHTSPGDTMIGKRRGEIRRTEQWDSLASCRLSVTSLCFDLTTELGYTSRGARAGGASAHNRVRARRHDAVGGLVGLTRRCIAMKRVNLLKVCFLTGFLLSTPEEGMAPRRPPDGFRSSLIRGWPELGEKAS
jgi:hypothetical protein